MSIRIVIADVRTRSYDALHVLLLCLDRDDFVCRIITDLTSQCQKRLSDILDVIVLTPDVESLLHYSHFYRAHHLISACRTSSYEIVTGSRASAYSFWEA